MNKDSTHKVTLSIKNEAGLIYPAQAALKAYAEVLGFKAKECSHLELLLEEILSNTIKYNFMPGQVEDIHLVFEKTTLGMSTSIHSKSIPLDIEKIQSFENTTAEDIIKYDASGLGMFMINRLADTINYSNKGKEGQYIYFEKHLPAEAAERSIVFEQADAELTVHTDFEFYSRRLKSEEAYFISQLAYYAYHVSYMYEYIYYPEIVRKLNQDGGMISVVAVNKANEEIIGHVAAIREELSQLPEMAVAFVNPRYRGGGCLQKISDYLIDMLREKEDEGVMVHAVTTHPYSQKAAYKLNFRETALLISRVHPLVMVEIKETDKPRESMLYMYLRLAASEPKTVYVPHHHADMVNRIFENTGQPVSIITEPQGGLVNDNPLTEIEVSTDAQGCSHMFIKRYGLNAKNLIEKTLKSLCVNNSETIYLHLPLDRQETLLYYAEFESLQFFFGGVFHQKDNQDYLLLQYLNNYIYPYETVVVFSDFAKELLDYIKKHDKSYNLVTEA